MSETDSTMYLDAKTMVENLLGAVIKEHSGHGERLIAEAVRSIMLDVIEKYNKAEKQSRALLSIYQNINEFAHKISATKLSAEQQAMVDGISQALTMTWYVQQ